MGARAKFCLFLARVLVGLENLLLANVEPHENRLCRRCTADGKRECMMLKDSEINNQVFKLDRCASCIRLGQRCIL